MLQHQDVADEILAYVPTQHLRKAGCANSLWQTACTSFFHRCLPPVRKDDLRHLWFAAHFQNPNEFCMCLRQCYDITLLVVFGIGQWSSNK